MVSSATPVPEPSAEQAAREALFRTAGIDPHDDDFIAAVDAYRAAVLHDAIEAARGEYLHEPVPDSEADEAYQNAVSDVIGAIDALRDAQTGGEGRE